MEKRSSFRIAEWNYQVPSVINKGKAEFYVDIPSYEGLYQVSNWGRVKSLNYRRTGKEKILKQSSTADGYQQVVLFKNGKKKFYYVHRLVYEAFIGKIPKGMQVNHSDENKQNNVLSNINTLMTPKENINWGTGIERKAKSQSKSVIQKSLDGKVIKIWPSANEIQRELGYSTGSICACCRGGHYVKGKWYNLNQAYGYIWQYEDADTN